jgi:lipoprotein-anchoring transpeptidase ErfK/SrfK
VSRAEAGVLGAVLSVLLSGAPADAAADGELAPSFERSYAARVVTPTPARSAPDAAADVRTRLAGETAWAHGPMQLLVLDDRRDSAGARWLRVRLPRRPNAAAGWVDADHVRLRSNPWRVTISTRTRSVRVHRAGKLARRFRAVVGKPGTPTPHGLFALYERARQPDPSGFIGPWALHLTAHSNVLRNYGGGPGRIAIHGRSGASLLDPLGSGRSHGCVRVPNTDVRRLARTLPVGTPVRIRR